MGDRITLHVGPAPAAVAAAWAANRQQLVAAARESSPFPVNAEVLDLLDGILGLWLVEAARSEVFDWHHEIDLDVLLVVAKYWLDLGQLTSEQRAAMGVPASDARTETFTGVVIAGIVPALRESGAKGQALLERLGL